MKQQLLSGFSAPLPEAGPAVSHPRGVPAAPLSRGQAQWPGLQWAPLLLQLLAPRLVSFLVKGPAPAAGPRRASSGARGED